MTDDLVAGLLRDSAGLAKSTLRQRRETLNRFHSSLGGRSLVEATPGDFESFATNRSDRTHLRAFFAWAVRTGHLATDPTTRIAPSPWVTFDACEAATIREHLAWLERRNLRPTYVSGRVGHLSRLRRRLGVALLDATAVDLGAWYERLALSPASRQGALAHVRGFYSWALLEELIDRDPSARLIRPRSVRRLPRPMPDADFTAAMVDAPPVVRQILGCAAFAGLRACEIAQLDRGDVHDDTTPPILIVREGKGGRSRIVPLSPQLSELLNAPEMPRHGLLFVRAGSAAPLGANRVSKVAGRYLHNLGITHTLHSLRHWFGTNLYRDTLDLRLTQEMLGHGSPATTALYAAFSPDRAASAVGRLHIPESHPAGARGREGS